MHQTLSGCDQAHKDIGGCTNLTGLRILLPLSATYGDLFSCDQIITVTGIWRRGNNSCDRLYLARKLIHDIIIPMDDKHLLHRLLKGTDPLQQLTVVCMSTDSRKILDPCCDLDFLSEKPNFLRSVKQVKAQRSRNLESYKKDRGIASPQVVLQIERAGKGI